MTKRHIYSLNIICKLAHTIINTPSLLSHNMILIINPSFSYMIYNMYFLYKKVYILIFTQILFSFMYKHIYVDKHIRAILYTHTHTHTHIYIYTHTHTHAHMYTFIYIYNLYLFFFYRATAAVVAVTGSSLFASLFLLDFLLVTVLLLFVLVLG
jgi:hypothetical protein